MIREAITAIATKSTLRALRHRDFALVELVGWFSSAGVWLYRIGLQVLAWELTHSGMWLGIIALAEAAPAIVLAPVAGTLADRHDRLFLGRIVQAVIATVTVLLAVMTIAGLVDIWTLAVLAVLHGTSVAFWTPLRLAMVPNFVPREDLPSAIALHATLFNLARFMGPLMAAPVLVKWGSGALFGLNAGCYLVYLSVLFVVTLTNPDKRAEAGRSMFAYVVEGLGYAARHPALKYIFLNAAFIAVFLRAYMELLPGITETLFGHDPKQGVAILVSAAGLGAIASSLIVGNISRIDLLIRAYFTAMVLALIFFALFATTSHFWFAVVCASFLSGSQIGVNISAQVMIQSAVRGELRGRVMSLWGLINRSGPAVGGLLLGATAELVGFRWPVLAAGALTAMVAFFVLSRRATMRRELVKTEPGRAAQAPRPAAPEPRPAE